ncbi:uncharacterized protein LOC143021986 [Oratosquilla oratoria]|uniref:uncharacterized protein LOC143021986 n=1 Tax=Oratosquilla oratoria TaxID=337810 RepID=UPI003F768FA6
MMATAITTTNLSFLLPTTPAPVPPTPPWINTTSIFIAAIIMTTAIPSTNTVSSTTTIVTHDYPAPLPMSPTLSECTTFILASKTSAKTTITSSPDPRRGTFPTPSEPTDRVVMAVRPLLNATTTSSKGDPHFPTYIRVWASVVVVVILLVGVTGNALVPLLVWRNRDLRHSTNLFLINLALADTLVLLVCLPTVLVELHSPPETWVLGPIMCKLVPFLELVVAHASVLTIVVISVERYLSICQPLRSPALCTRTRAALFNAFVWILTVLATLPMLWLSQLSTYKYFDGSVVYICLTPVNKEWQKNYYLGSIGVFFVLPLVLLLVLYSLIVARLIAYRRRTSRNIESPLWKSRKQVVAMLAAVVTVFFVCLLPFRVFVVWIILAPEKAVQLMGLEMYYNVLYVCRVLIYINSAANPVIYNAMSSKFRSAFQRLLGMPSANGKSLLRRQSTITTSTSTSTISSGFSFRRRSSDSNSRKASLIRALLRKEEEVNWAVEEERRAWGVASFRRVPQEGDVMEKERRMAVEESKEKGRDGRGASVLNRDENDHLHLVALYPSNEDCDLDPNLGRRLGEKVGVSGVPPDTGTCVQDLRDVTCVVPKKVSFDDDASKDHGKGYSPPLRGRRRGERRDMGRFPSLDTSICVQDLRNVTCGVPKKVSFDDGPSKDHGKEYSPPLRGRRRGDRRGMGHPPSLDTSICVQDLRNVTCGVPKKVSFDDGPSKDHGKEYSPPLRGRRRGDRRGMGHPPSLDTSICVQDLRNVTCGVPKKVSFDDGPSKDHGKKYSPPPRGRRRGERRDMGHHPLVDPRSCLSVTKLAVSSRRNTDFRYHPVENNPTHSFVANNKNQALPGIMVNTRPKLVTTASSGVKDSFPEPFLQERISGQEEASSSEFDHQDIHREQQENRVSYFDNDVPGEDTLLYMSGIFNTKV